MAFLYPEAHRGGYWMKDTLIPLDIAFADGRGKILRIFTMQPCRSDPCRIYDPEVAYRSVLEVNAGSFRRWRVRRRRPDHRPGDSSGRDRQPEHVRPVVVAGRVETLALLRAAGPGRAPRRGSPPRRRAGLRDSEPSGARIALPPRPSRSGAFEQLARAGSRPGRSDARWKWQGATTNARRLARDVHERRLPGVAVVGGRGDVDLDAGLVEREARERHVVLPADQAAEPAERRLDRAQPAAVALAPDEPLVVRRHELAVVERQLAVGRVVEQRVVERPGRSGSGSLTPMTSQTPCSRAIAPSRSASGPGTRATRGASSANASFAPGSAQPASAFAQTDDGYAGMKVSGKTTSCAPARRRLRRQRSATRSIVRVAVEDRPARPGRTRR